MLKGVVALHILTLAGCNNAKVKVKSPNQSPNQSPNIWLEILAAFGKNILQAKKA
jgi:hypothetical protein